MLVEHLKLHFNDYGKAKESEQARGVEGNKIDSVEWQAQYFVSCLLMPKSILKEKRESRNLSKWSKLDEIKDEIGVSTSKI